MAIGPALAFFLVASSVVLVALRCASWLHRRGASATFLAIPFALLGILALVGLFVGWSDGPDPALVIRSSMTPEPLDVALGAVSALAFGATGYLVRARGERRRAAALNEVRLHESPA